MQFTKKLARISLIVLSFFLALSAIAGGVGLLTGWNTPPVQDLGASIFRDYTVPGLALLLIVGGGAMLSAVLLVRRHALALPVTAAAEFAIIFFEFVEILVIGSPPGIARTLQIIYFGVGALMNGILHRSVAAGFGRRSRMKVAVDSGERPPSDSAKSYEGEIMRIAWTPALVLLSCALVLSACNLPESAAGAPASSIAPVAVLTTASPCWSGPGEAFTVIVALSPGQDAEIAGQTTDGAYLLVRDPGNPAALCWIKSITATVVGSLSGLPTYDGQAASTLVSGCPSPVGGGPTPVDCSASVGSGCPSPVGGGPTPVDCSAGPALAIGCPSPVGGGPTPVDCSGSGGPALIIGCPSPIGGGPTPVSCSGSGGPAPVYGCPSPIGGGPTPVSCSGSGGPAPVYGCPSPIGGGPTPVDCSGSSAAPPAAPAGHCSS